MQGLFSRMLHLVRDRASSESYAAEVCTTAWLWWWEGWEEGIFPFPLPFHGVRGKERSQLSCSHTCRLCSPAPIPTEPALVHCPGEMQGLLLWVELSLWVGRQHQFSQSIPPTTGSEGWRKREGSSLSLTHSSIWQVKGRARSPMHILAPNHLYLHQQGKFYYAAQARCRAHSPECCSQWEAGPSLPPLGPWDQLFPPAVGGKECGLRSKEGYLCLTHTTMGQTLGLALPLWNLQSQLTCTPISRDSSILDSSF